MSYISLALGFRRFLDHPAKVVLCCLGIFCISIILNGNAFRLWGLHRDFDRISADIESTKHNITSLSFQLQQAKDPVYMERQARDKLDLAGEHDLVFVFAD